MIRDLRIYEKTPTDSLQISERGREGEREPM